MTETSNTAVRRGIYTGSVVRNVRLCDEHYLVCIALESFPPSRPGQFVQLQCRGLEEQTALREIPWPACEFPKASQAELTNREPMLRRPLSLAGRRDLPGGGVEIDIIYRTIGAGTNWLSGIGPGQALSVLGPLGNGFAIHPEKPFAALVGGGVGIPPMLYLAAALNSAGIAAAAFVGVRSQHLLPVTIIHGSDPAADGHPTPCIREFNFLCTDAAVASDDGSIGYHGLVSEAFIRWLKAHRFGPEQVTVYACGPEPMERSIADLCLMREIECQLALERHMACGMGTCQSCVVKVRDDASPDGWKFKLCCTDGPVFDATCLLW